MLLVLLLGSVVTCAAEPIHVLRVCADPDNMPFSSSTPTDQGLYVELAELIAGKMGIPTKYFWWPSYFGKRTVRNSLLSDRCDAYFGLPYGVGFMERNVLLIRPFLSLGYVIMAPTALRIAQLDDLKGRTVGVEFKTEPHIMLASQDGFQVATFRLIEGVMDALQRGEVDTAFVWGPVAGYYNKTRLGGTFQIIPMAGSGLQWQVAVGVKKGNEQLQAALEQALEHLQPDIQRLANKYGFPLTSPVALTAPQDPTPPASSASPPAPAPAQRNPWRDDASTIPAGRSLFNQHCAHCHSPNAINPEPRTDLRRLKGRYGENRSTVFFTTVTEGRPTKGMPAWTGVLSEEKIWQLLTFIESVQNTP